MTERFVAENPERFEAAIEGFDAANSLDPNREWEDGKMHPRELVYGRWLTDWVLKLKPDASEALRLAARAAHLRRWEIARESYAATRAGYLAWRADLKKFHAREASAELAKLGYPENLVRHVQGLIDKSLFPEDPDSRILEDALCLVFLEHQFAALAKKSSEKTIINALQKAWKKMSVQAREIALTLRYAPSEAALLEQALKPGPVS